MAILEQTASAMSPQSWSQIHAQNTHGYTQALWTDPGNNSSGVGSFCDLFHWRASTKQAWFIGADAANQAAAGKVLSYDETGDAWTVVVPNIRTVLSPLAITQITHGYEQSALDSATGMLYYMTYNSRRFWRYNTATNSWTELASVPSGVISGFTVTSAMALVPGFGIVLVNGGIVAKYDIGSDTWSQLTSGKVMGSHQMFCEWNPILGILLFGGGTNNTRKLHKIALPSGTVTSLNDAIIDVGVQWSVTTHDPITGKFLFLGNDGVFRQYDVDAQAWTTLSAPPFSVTPNVTNIQVVSIPAYGVTYWIKNSHTQWGSNSNGTWLYRHTAGLSSATSNSIRVYNTSGSTITNRPVSIARPFVKGELAGFAQAVISGGSQLTQCDVKNRWSDGSLKFAIVSFVIPTIASGGSVQVLFQNQSTGNNTGFLDQAGMLAAGYNFGGTITMSSPTRTANARTMLSAGDWRYWLQGPIVTAVIIENRTTSRTYDLDFGDGSKALHPIFEAWFYPQGNRVQLGYAMENCWSSTTAINSMRDLTYSAVLASGNTGPTTEFTNPSFTHVGRTRWHRVYWIGTDPPAIRVDHNLGYLVTTKAIPNYDPTIVPDPQYENSRFTAFELENDSFAEDGLYSTSMDSGGVADWIGLHNTWETMWLYSMSANGWAMLVGNADQAGRIPMFFREADTQAGTGLWFDQQYTQQTNLSSAGTPLGTGTVDTFGRVISVNARRTVGLRSVNGVGVDTIVTGTITGGGYASVDMSHLPDVSYLAYLFTGRYYYLELLQMEAAYCIGNKTAGWGSDFGRPGDVGLINHTNVRGDAWGLKLVVHASFMSPDSTPEQAYFLDKLKDNIAAFEGLQNLSLSYSTKQQQWNWGRNTRTQNPYYLQRPGPSPLGQWSSGTSTFIQAPLLNNNSLYAGTSNWEENFLLCVMGRARDMELALTDVLLRFMAKKRFRINLTTVSGTTLQNFIEAYRDPTIRNPSNLWIANFQEFVSHYDTTIEPYIGRRTNLDPDHNYAFIALAADSFLYPYTVDGFSGSTAWLNNKTTTPNQQHFVSGHSNASPKWAIMPYGTTPAPSAPDPPGNLRKVSS